MSVFSKGEEKLRDLILVNPTIIVTSTTIDFIDMALNWYKSLERVNTHHLAFVIALDKFAYCTLEENNIPCALIDASFTNNTASEWIENAKIYKPMGPLYIYNKYFINLLHLDTDIVFLKEFISKIEQESEGADIVMASDRRFDSFHHKRIKDKIISVNFDKKTISDWGLAEQAKYGEKNGAIMYLPRIKKEKNLHYLKTVTSKEIYKHFPKGVQDGSLQTISNNKQLIQKTNINIKTLSVYDFPNGSIWKVPYLRKNIKDTCYMVHYNFHSHAGPKQRLKDKITAMKKFGHWYL